MLLNTAHETLPSVLHWGADLGDLSPVELASIALTAQRPPVGASVDVPLELGLVPESSSGWLGTPGLLGHRDGASFSTRFLTTGITVEDLDQDPTISSRVRITAADEAVGLDLTIVLELAHSGLLKAQASVTNTGEGLYELQALDVALPVPNYTSEILDLAAAEGLLMLQAGPDVLRFVPALNIDDAALGDGLARLARALRTFAK